MIVLCIISVSSQEDDKLGRRDEQSMLPGEKMLTTGRSLASGHKENWPPCS